MNILPHAPIIDGHGYMQRHFRERLLGLVEWVEAPSAASDAGRPGQAAYESGYLYICVDDDTWQRVAIATW